MLTVQQIETYWARLLEAGSIDFSGVIYYSAILLESLPDVATAGAASFARIIVDEFKISLLANCASCAQLLAQAHPSGC